MLPLFAELKKRHVGRANRLLSHSHFSNLDCWQL